MKGEWLEYQCAGKNFKGYLAYNEKDSSPKPAVIVAHAWKGQDDFARNKADFLAELGYVGFAVDLYGEGACVNTNDEAGAMMTPLFINRSSLRERIVSAYHTIAKHERVDAERIGAIGFCFGGLSVLELLRSGNYLRGVVSFHGLLGDTLGENKAQIIPSANKLHGSLLILHGYRDPLVSKEDIENIQNEFTKANIDWQMHIYGNASHAFTNPNANDPDSGLIYHPITEERSLQTMKYFLSEVLE